MDSAIDPWGLKIAEHTTSTDSELIDPYLLDNELTESDRQSVDTFVDNFLNLKLNFPVILPACIP